MGCHLPCSFASLVLKVYMSNRKLAGPVLCPVDLSEHSEAVVRLAASIARSCPAPLSLIHASASEVPPYFTPGGVEQLEAELERNRNEVRRKLAALAEGVPGAEIRVEDGEPLSVILRLSESLHPSMIVMGTHGHKGLARIVDGSVAEALVHSSSVPVLTVGPGDRISSQPSIVCAVTGSELSRAALSWAIRLAQCLGTRLTVLHVVEPGQSNPNSDLCGWVGGDRPPACDIQEVVRHGNAAEEVLRLANELGAGLLVIGAAHKFISDKTEFGATAEKLLRHAPCPVLTVFPANQAS